MDYSMTQDAGDGRHSLMPYWRKQGFANDKYNYPFFMIQRAAFSGYPLSVKTA